jgi:hypothetical protein
MSQTDTVPNEIKEVNEAALFQQYFNYTEQIPYTDLLIGLIKSIRSRWNSTNSSMSSNSSVTNKYIKQPMHQHRVSSNSMEDYYANGKANSVTGVSGNNYSLGDTVSASNNGSNSANRPTINIQFRRYDIKFILFFFFFVCFVFISSS